MRLPTLLPSINVQETRTPPLIRVFVSATSGDLRSVRQVVKEALLTIDCHPVEQTNFGPDWRTVQEMLTEKIEGCHALIHIAGFRYGAEPDPATLPAGTPRRSYTQIEYSIGRELQTNRGEQHFRVYTFVCSTDFPYDEPIIREGGELPKEADDVLALQRVHRQNLLSDPHLYEQPADVATVEASVLSLREQVLALFTEQLEVRQEVRQARRFGLRAVVAILLTLVLVGLGVLYSMKGNANLAKKQDVLRHDFDLARLTERVLIAYQDRFGQLRQQNKELTNSVIDEMIRAELPGTLNISNDLLKSILDVEAPKIAARQDTPLDIKLRALFVMHQYQAVLQQGKSRLIDPTLTGLHTMGDAALARFDEKPEPQLIKDALRYYQGAAALTDRERDALSWAERQLAVAFVLDRLDRYPEAEAVLRPIVEMLEGQPGKAVPTLATALNNLGSVLRLSHRTNEAETAYQKAVVLFEAHFGDHDPNTAIVIGNYANLLNETGRRQQAEPLFRRALTIFESRFGPGNVLVANVANNLAVLLGNEEAESLFERARIIYEASNGPDHPTVAAVLNNRAMLLKRLRRPTEAEPLFRRALAIYEASYGIDCPTVGTIADNLAMLLMETNRPKEAEPFLRQALAIYEVNNGPDDPIVAIGLTNLAAILRYSNRPTEAEPLLRRVVSICEKRYGPDDPEVAKSLNNLAFLLQRANRLEEADPLYQRSLTILFKFCAANAQRSPVVVEAVRNYIELCAGKEMSEDEILDRLAKLREGATLDGDTFRQIVKEALDE
jgi:tetratricopeptide (TPR) repeat protein